MVSAFSVEAAAIVPSASLINLFLGVSSSLRDNGNATTFVLLPFGIHRPSKCPILISTAFAVTVKSRLSLAYNMGKTSTTSYCCCRGAALILARY